MSLHLYTKIAYTNTGTRGRTIKKASETEKLPNGGSITDRKTQLGVPWSSGGNTECRRSSGQAACSSTIKEILAAKMLRNWCHYSDLHRQVSIWLQISARKAPGQWLCKQLKSKNHNLNIFSPSQAQSKQCSKTHPHA